MKFKANTSQDFELAPEGNHVSICNAVIDLGVQPGSVAYPAPKHQVYLRFELTNELVERDGKTAPIVIGRNFTASMHEKAALRKFIEGWFGKKFVGDAAAEEFDLSKLLGRLCLVNVTHYTGSDGKERAGLQSIAPIPKGMAIDDVRQVNKSLYFDIETSTEAEFALLPEWMKKKIDARFIDKKESEKPNSSQDDEFDSEIPF